MITELDDDGDLEIIAGSGSNLFVIDSKDLQKKEESKDKQPIKENKENIENSVDANNDSEDDKDEEEEGLNVSLAAMEEKLKPKVLNDFDEITKLFKKLHKYIPSLSTL